MKQQIISGLKKELLLIELPEGANRLSVFNDEQPYLSYFKGHDTRRFYLPSRCVLIGKLTDITEDQFKEWVFRSMIGNYKDYTYVPKYYDVDKTGLIDALLEMKFKTAKESFFSKLAADEIHFENKLGKKTRTML